MMAVNKNQTEYNALKTSNNLTYAAMSNLSISSTQQRRRQHKRQRVKLTLSAVNLRNPRNSGMRMSMLRTVTAGKKGSSSPSPFAVVTKLAAFGSGEEHITIGRTEAIPYTNHPQWTKHFICDFELGEEQFIDVSLYCQGCYNDDDSDNTNKNKKVKMGSAKVEIGRILGMKRNRLMVNISQPCGGSLYAHVAPLDDNDGYDEKGNDTMIRMEVSAKLRRRSMVDSMISANKRTYFEIQTQEYFISGCVWRPIYRSSVVNNPNEKDIDSDWSNCMFHLSDVNSIKKKGDNNDGAESENLHAPLRIMVWDHRKRKHHAVVGSVETTLAKLKKQWEHSDSGASFDLCKGGEPTASKITIKDVQFIGGNESDRMSQDMSEETTGTSSEIDAHVGGENGVKVAENEIEANAQVDEGNAAMEVETSNSPSVVHFNTPTSIPQTPKAPNFVDYLCGGCELDLMVAIDCTSSNGNPLVPGTPHYIDPRSTLQSDVRNWNEYEQAIKAIGDILVKYDSDKMVPVWGFGAVS